MLATNSAFKKISVGQIKLICGLGVIHASLLCDFLDSKLQQPHS